MPRNARYEIKSAAPGKALWEHDGQIGRVASEIAGLQARGCTLADMDTTIDFLYTLIRRRIAIRQRLAQDAKELGTSPGELYRRNA